MQKFPANLHPNKRPHLNLATRPLGWPYQQVRPRDPLLLQFLRLPPPLSPFPVQAPLRLPPPRALLPPRSLQVPLPLLPFPAQALLRLGPPQLPLAVRPRAPLPFQFLRLPPPLSPFPVQAPLRLPPPRALLPPRSLQVPLPLLPFPAQALLRLGPPQLPLAVRPRAPLPLQFLRLPRPLLPFPAQALLRLPPPRAPQSHRFPWLSAQKFPLTPHGLQERQRCAVQWPVLAERPRPSARPPTPAAQSARAGAIDRLQLAVSRPPNWRLRFEAQLLFPSGCPGHLGSDPNFYLSSRQSGFPFRP